MAVQRALIYELNSEILALPEAWAVVSVANHITWRGRIWIFTSIPLTISMGLLSKYKTDNKTLIEIVKAELLATYLLTASYKLKMIRYFQKVVNDFNNQTSWYRNETESWVHSLLEPYLIRLPEIIWPISNPTYERHYMCYKVPPLNIIKWIYTRRVRELYKSINYDDIMRTFYDLPKDLFSGTTIVNKKTTTKSTRSKQ